MIERGILEGDPHTVSLPGAAPRMTEKQRALAKRIESRYEEAAFMPPDNAELAAALGARESEIRAIIDLCASAGTLVHLGGGFHLHASHERDMRRRVTEALASTSGLAVSEIRDLLGTSAQVRRALLRIPRPDRPDEAHRRCPRRGALTEFSSRRVVPTDSRHGRTGNTNPRPAESRPGAEGKEKPEVVVVVVVVLWDLKGKASLLRLVQEDSGAPQAVVVGEGKRGNGAPELVWVPFNKRDEKRRLCMGRRPFSLTEHWTGSRRDVLSWLARPAPLNGRIHPPAFGRPPYSRPPLIAFLHPAKVGAFHHRLRSVNQSSFTAPVCKSLCLMPFLNCTPSSSRS